MCVDGDWGCTKIGCIDPGPDALEVGDCPTGGDAITVDAVTLDGDTLKVDAGFSGGCEEHTVTACWDGSFLESSPVQARITLYHDANGDTCEAYLQATYSFDLAPMKQSYIDGYQTDEGTILLTVDGEGAEYTF